MTVSASGKSLWLEEAMALKPRLFSRTLRPSRLVKAVADASAFQGWRMEPCGNAEEAFAELRDRSWELVFDFGEHCVGTLEVEMEGVVDCPQRLSFVFGETPAEIGESFSSYKGSLGKAWLQEESVTLDWLPATFTLPRRYAFRYVKIASDLNAPAFRARLAGLRCHTQSSADASLVKPLKSSFSPLLRRIDEISLKTLENCMQEVFEDGPKRDRRLWLGDFRLQALLNYGSFKNYALAKRCLLLFAALSDDNGLVPTCLFHKPQPHPARDRIFDYICLFGASLLEYAEASGDWALAEKLWPIALRQAQIALSEHGPDGLFQNKAKWWLFIDWDQELDRTCAEQASSVHCLWKTAELAKKLGHLEDAKELEGKAAELSAAALKHMFDAKRGVFLSGPAKQLSWASQIWMTLAGAIAGEQAAAALQTALAEPAARKAVSPYLRHYLVEALFKCGLEKEAFAQLESYWGEMARLGADTFWEVFDSGNHKLSPYGSHLMNSACHAWSCTPSWFLRKR